MPHSRILLALVGAGVCLCAACGSKFTSAGATDGDAGAAASADGGSSAAAATDSGGDAGATSTAGSGGATSAGSGGTINAGAGGTISAGAGGTISAGAGGSSAGHGGRSGGAGGSSAGSGGTSGKGGATGTAGSSGTAGATDCQTLEAEYTPLLEKARVCDKGSMGQCSASSTLSPVGGCACPVLVNAKSAATTAAQKKYQELQDNKCLNGGVVCNAFCVPPMGASCEQQMSGTTTAAFMCTASLAVAN